MPTRPQTVYRPPACGNCCNCPLRQDSAPARRPGRLSAHAHQSRWSPPARQSITAVSSAPASALGAPGVAMAVAVDRTTGEHVTGPAATRGRAGMEEGTAGTDLARSGRRLHIIEALARA